MSDVPTLKGELDRKAVETLEMMEAALSAGRITPEQYAFAVDVIWSSWAGLVSKDIMLMVEVMGEKRVKTQVRTYLYRGDGHAVAVSNDLCGVVRVEYFMPGELPVVKTIDKSDFTNPAVAGREAFEKVVAALEGRGYIKI